MVGGKEQGRDEGEGAPFSSLCLLFLRRRRIVAQAEGEGLGDDLPPFPLSPLFHDRYERQRHDQENEPG